jgi:hypothetical protein
VLAIVRAHTPSRTLRPNGQVVKVPSNSLSLVNENAQRRLASEVAVLEIPDDSGFLALVVPATYESFVAENWDFNLLRSHFRRQMARHSMLIWGTGLEGMWRVDVRVDGPDVRGQREVVGPLDVVGGSVFVAAYESLSMAAQFADVVLPQAHERDQLVPIPDGVYTCRVIQMFDPDACESAEGESYDFVVLLSATTLPVREWSEILWS